MEESDKIFCVECGLEKESKFCRQCQKETPNLFKVCISDTVKVRDSIRIIQKRPGFKGFLKKVFSGFKPSTNPKLSEGVEVQMEIDREKNEYHHVVKDNKTGKILHEEHELLTNHKSKNKN
ncbi:MAG: hypothetical protein ACKKMS_00280 [Candidatus Nealsonbacteria bacterium]